MEFHASNNRSWSKWDAKDLFQFPGSEATLVQYDYFIEVHCGDNISVDYVLAIPVNFDEYIVSINFADNDTQNAWISELCNMNK